MPVKQKTMADLKAAKDEGRIVAIWGTAAVAYAIVENHSIKKHALEMWAVTP